MSSKKHKAPAIRFKDFTDAWEQRKLGDLADIIGGGTPSTSNPEYWNGIIDWYSPVEIGEQIYVNGSQKTITELGLQKSSAKILPVGTVLFTSRAGIGNTAILAKEGATNQGFQSIVPNKNKLDSYFIFSRTHELKRYGETNGAGSTFIEVSGKQMANMPILIPQLEEQIKIGNFFKEIDNTIALHQRQLDNYKALKKAILQKIFNQELRFKDENGNEYPKWMRKTVNDIGDVVTGTTPSTKEKAYYNNGIYPWVTPTDIVQKNIDSTPRKLTEQGLSKGRMLPENTILVTCIASIGKNAILKQKGSCNQQINAIVCNKNHNYEFVFYLMEKNTDVLKSLAGKGTMDIVNKDVFSKMQVTVPCLEEQLRIGEFLSELDGKIEDEHKIVNLMKKQKQGLMQRMFV